VATSSEKKSVMVHYRRHSSAKAHLRVDRLN
jgi:hypothetical protein